MISEEQIMTTPIPEPHWTAFVTALGTPIIAALAAFVAGLVAYRNWRTAQNKLKFDMFDKRIKVYATLCDTITSSITVDTIDSDQLQLFMTASNDTEWLFNVRIATHLKEHTFGKLRVFKSTADAFASYSEHRGFMNMEPPEREKLAKDLEYKKLSAKQNLLSELSVLNNLFAPYLRLSH